MKGLLLKDLYILYNYRRNALLLLAMALVLGFTQVGTAVIPGFLLFVTCTYVMGLFSYDEYVDWEKYQAGLPIPRPRVVAARYAIAFGLLVAVGLASLAMAALAAALKPLFSPAEPADLLTLALSTGVIFLLCALIMAVLLPLCYKLGPEKVRFTLFIIYAAVFAVVFVLLYFFSDALESIASRVPASASSFAVLPAVAVLVILGLAFASYKISVRIYRNKEF